MVEHVYNPSFMKLSSEDHEFKANTLQVSLPNKQEPSSKPK